MKTFFASFLYNFFLICSFKTVKRLFLTIVNTQKLLGTKIKKKNFLSIFNICRFLVPPKTETQELNEPNLKDLTIIDKLYLVFYLYLSRKNHWTWCDDGCASCDFYIYTLMWFLKASATRTIDSSHHEKDRIVYRSLTINNYDIYFGSLKLLSIIPVYS